MGIDRKHKLDVTSRLDPNQARKWLAEVLNLYGVKVASLSTHCQQEMLNDHLIPEDVFQVLRDGNIYNFPEFENGSYRYRVETQKIVVVIIFKEPNIVRCITTWRKS